MALLSDIGSVRIGEDSVPLRVAIQGYGSTWRGTLNDADGDPMDLSAAAISAEAEFATCTLTLTTARGVVTATLTNIALMRDPDTNEVLDRRMLDVTIDPDQSANAGVFRVVIPTDLYTGSIPPDITVEVPVVIGYLRVQNGTETRVGRFLIAFRRGVTE